MRKTTCLFMAVVMILALTFVGCGGRESSEEAVTNALIALNNLDTDIIQKYFVYEDLFLGDSNDAAELLSDEDSKLFFQHLSFNIISSEEDGENATVKTEITNIDMVEIIKEFFLEAISRSLGNAFGEDAVKDNEEFEAELKQIMVDLLQRENNKVVTSTVDIKLTKNESSWKISISEELKDALLGGLVSAADSLNDLL